MGVTQPEVAPTLVMKEDYERLPFLSHESAGVRDSVMPRYFTEPVAYAVLPEHQVDLDT